jgi:hypothetical protein
MRLTMAQIYARGLDDLTLGAVVKCKKKHEIATELCSHEKDTVDAMPDGKGMRTPLPNTLVGH